MQKLIIEDDEGRATVVPLVRDELTIGRKEGNAIRLTERNVSRRHARLFKQNGSVFVEDLASYTGVRLNGTRIAGQAQVHDGDQVEIGDYKLAVRTEATAPAMEAAPAAAPASAQPAVAPAVAPAPAAKQPINIAAAPAPAPSAPAPAPAAALAPAPATAPASAPVAEVRQAGVAREAIDAAPTLPIRTLAEQGKLPDLGRLKPSRLVVVTSDLAGTEFRLDRPSLVVGRTDENDIILNHPSISRHHAKVLRDGDRYSIVDLQSSNGVRVSGEGYERVDVHPGDVVELGHVKLRFVGPMEDWTFDPQEFAPKSRRGLKIGAAVGGVILAVTLIVIFQGHKSEPAPGPAPPIAAVPAPPPPPAPSELLADATGAAKAERWDDATTKLDLLAARPATDPAVVAVKPASDDLRQKVTLERRAAPIFASYQQAVAAREPDGALARFDEIPAESMYKKRAGETIDDVKGAFLDMHLDQAEAARQQGHCDDAKAEAEKIEQVDPNNRRAKEIVKGCRPHGPARAAALAAAAPAPRPAAPAAAPRPPRPSPAPRPAVRAAVATNTAPDETGARESSQGGDATELIRQAREAWSKQECGQAIELSRRVLKVKPGANEAYQIIAACACAAKDRDGATRAYARLDDRNRSLVRAMCSKNGVSLE